MKALFCSIGKRNDGLSRPTLAHKRQKSAKESGRILDRPRGVTPAPPHLNPSPSFVVQEAGFFIGETGLYRLMLSHVVDSNPSQRRGTKRGTKRADGVIFQFVPRFHWETWVVMPTHRWICGGGADNDIENGKEQK